MKRIILTALLLASPLTARAGGLIDLNPAEKDLRDAQKKVKGGVDKETDKHHVTVGTDDDKKSGKKASGKKGKKADKKPESK